MNDTRSIFAKSTREPIAIVGVACRFPGAASKDKYWNLLEQGQSGIGEYPAKRSRLGMRLSDIYDPTGKDGGKMRANAIGMLNDIDMFDNDFFQISDHEARSMDPQQRMSLELVWDALEDSGLVPSQMRGSRTSTYAASVGTSYWASRLAYQDYDELLNSLDGYAMTGAASSILSGRIAYHYDFQGEAVTIDSACSSSLTATHLACTSIWSGSADYSVVVGTNAILTSDAIVGLSKGKVLARDGRCRPFSSDASGYGRAEGAGAVILMPLSRALDKGLNIYSCILETGVNNDGRSGGHMLAPSIKQQHRLIQDTWNQSAYDLQDAQYFEAHGTATQLGDTIEIKSISAACKDRPQSLGKLIIGSSKSNISHTEGAAGVASLIKAALAMKKGLIPPSIGIDQLNEHIDWQNSNVEICRELQQWRENGKGIRLGGINAFGFSGTNTHIIMAWHQHLDDHQKTKIAYVAQTAKSTESHTTIMVSAHNRTALLNRLSALGKFIDDNPSALPQDISHSLIKHRDHLPCRLAFSVDNSDNLRSLLANKITALKNLPEATLKELSTPAKLLVFWYAKDIATLLKSSSGQLLSAVAGQPGYQEFDASLQKVVGKGICELFALVNSDTANEKHIAIAIMAAEYLLITHWKCYGLEPDIFWVESKSRIAIGLANGHLSVENGVTELLLQENRKTPRTNQFLNSQLQYSSYYDKNRREVSVITFNSKTIHNSSLVDIFGENRVFHLLNRAGRKKEMLGSVDRKNYLSCDKLSHQEMLKSLIDLYIDNVHFNPENMALRGTLLQLPTYPFDKKPHWFAQYPEEVLLTVTGERAVGRG